MICVAIGVRRKGLRSGLFRPRRLGVRQFEPRGGNFKRWGVILGGAVFQAEPRISRASVQVVLHARFLAPLVKAQGFGMTPSRSVHRFQIEVLPADCLHFATRQEIDILRASVEFKIALRRHSWCVFPNCAFLL